MAFHSQHHTFDIHLASKYGLEEAIIIHHMQHWIRLNRRKGKNLKEGKCWTFDTMEHISDNFPYLNYEKVKYAIEKLVEYGVLVKGNFNKAGFDKTNWYAFVDEKAFGVDEESSKNLYDRENSPSIGKIPHRGGKIPEPIPDTIRKDTKESLSKEREGGKTPKPPRAENVTTTDEEHEKLVKDFGKDVIQMAYKHLSEWKQDVPKTRWRKSDNLAIRRWVIDALKKKGIKTEGPSKEKTQGNIPKWLKE